MAGGSTVTKPDAVNIATPQSILKVMLGYSDMNSNIQDSQGGERNLIKTVVLCDHRLQECYVAHRLNPRQHLLPQRPGVAPQTSYLSPLKLVVSLHSFFKEVI